MVLRGDPGVAIQCSATPANFFYFLDAFQQMMVGSWLSLFGLKILDPDRSQVGIKYFQT
jgi:hypothetical protein